MLILEETVEHRIPLPLAKTVSLKELIRKIPELKAHLIDATEQPINRPSQDQKRFYSGKKKMHTIKRQIIATPEKKIISVSETVEGTCHDKRLAEMFNYFSHAPPNSQALADNGYLGLDKLSSSVKVITPYKKPSGGELSDTEKAFNRQISSVRVRIEHVIGHLKFNRIFSDKVRYRTPIHDQVATIVCGLYNLKMET